MLIEELRNQRNEAAVQTMWKMSAAKGANTLERIFSAYARNDSGSKPKLFTKAQFVKEQRDMDDIKAQPSRFRGKALGMIGSFDWRRTPEFLSNLLTHLMGKNDRMNILSLVPGNALFGVDER